MRFKHWDKGEVHRDFPQFCVKIVSPVSVSTSRRTDPVIVINTQISQLVRMTRFWNNLHQVSSESKDWKAK